MYPIASDTLFVRELPFRRALQVSTYMFMITFFIVGAHFSSSSLPLMPRFVEPTAPPVDLKALEEKLKQECVETTIRFSM